MVRPTNFKLGIGLLMEHKDPHHRRAQWPQRSRVIRPVNVLMENRPYLRTGKAYELQTWHTDGEWKPASLACDFNRSKVKVIRRIDAQAKYGSYLTNRHALILLHCGLIDRMSVNICHDFTHNDTMQLTSLRHRHLGTGEVILACSI